MYESYCLIAITCISILCTILFNIKKRKKQDFRGRKELMFLIYSLIIVFVMKESQYVFSYLYQAKIIPFKIVSSISIAGYYIVYGLPLLGVTRYLFACIDRRITKLASIFLFLPIVVMDVLAIISIFTPCIFSVSDSGTLIYGPIYPYLAIMSLAYMLLDIFFAIKFRFMLEKGSFITFISLFIAPFFSLLIFYVIIFVFSRKSMSLIWIAMVIALTVHYFTFIQELLSNTDPLTNIANKQRLFSYLDKTFASKKREDFYGIMLDLDHFKLINDTYGHDVGDTALTQAAEILIKASPNDAFIARFAGDEFIIVYTTSDNDFPQKFYDNLTSEVEKFNSEVSSDSYKISFSLGYHLFSKDENYDIHSFLRLIDQRMYEDKRRKES